MEEYKIPQSIWKLAQEHKTAANFAYPKEAPKIQVEHMVAKLALVYEKLRYAVDYKEEHLLRRNAIERITKRMFLWGQEDFDQTALTLIQELIRAGYVQNNFLPENKIKEVSNILRRYLLLVAHLPEAKNSKQRRQAIRWLIGVASVEIEAALHNSDKELLLLENFYTYCKSNLVLQNIKIDDKIKNKQLFVASHRVLLKSDPATISYYLFKMYVPHWQDMTDREVQHTAAHVYHVKNMIDTELSGTLAEQIAKVINRPAVYFSILGDVFRENAKNIDETLFDVNTLKEEITLTCNHRYKIAKKKLRRGAINSIIYIFLTKILLAFIIEVPYDLFTVGSIHYFPLIANIGFHPFLVFMIAVSTRVPSEKNTLKIIDGIMPIVYNLPSEKIIYRFKKTAQPGSSSYVVVNIIYTMLYLITFGIIFAALSHLGFNLASGFLFIFFLAIVTFFGIRIRNSARELVILQKKENALAFLFDLLTLPLLRVGRWISRTSTKVNIFIFLFDYILENPFKLIVKGIESGVLFIRQKKEEVYD